MYTLTALKNNNNAFSARCMAYKYPKYRHSTLCFVVFEISSRFFSTREICPGHAVLSVDYEASRRYVS